ncbi:hypothetical protein GF312_11585, partial [Candidatus Poribacteria bacterium]|nr:hypothetical protein [Candidatus Poribacteria bacterium]
ADMTIIYNDKPWDFAAGGLLIEEAGGKMTTLMGDKWSPYISEFVGSNGQFHDEVIQLLRSFLI